MHSPRPALFTVLLMAVAFGLGGAAVLFIRPVPGVPPVLSLADGTRENAPVGQPETPPPLLPTGVLDHLIAQFTQAMNEGSRAEFTTLCKSLPVDAGSRRYLLDSLVFQAAVGADEFYIDHLISLGADIHGRTDQEQTCVASVVQQMEGADALFRVLHLSQCGLDINTADKRGNSLLHYAAQNDSAPLAYGIPTRMFIPIDPLNHLGQTPLILCAIAGHSLTGSYLLHLHADPTLKDASGRSAIDYAAQEPDEDDLQQYPGIAEGRHKLLEEMQLSEDRKQHAREYRESLSAAAAPAGK